MVGDGGGARSRGHLVVKRRYTIRGYLNNLINIYNYINTISTIDDDHTHTQWSNNLLRRINTIKEYLSIEYTIEKRSINNIAKGIFIPMKNI